MIPRRPKVSGWDLAAIGLLGATGFSLSYDALEQMAQAIHVRGELSYAWPVVVDGFIAYGVRALVLLREAPWTARAYAWALFAGATGTSVWANALHAIRLNEQTHAGELHLGDAAVGSLSTIAPIALAGAVHLGIIVTRHGGTRDAPDDTGREHPSAEAVTLNRAATPGQPLSLDKPSHTPTATPELTLSRSERPELTAGRQEDRAKTAGEKLAAHRQGSRWRDRLAARILRRAQHSSGGPSEVGPVPRSGGPSEVGPAARSGGPSEVGPAARSGGPSEVGPVPRSGGPSEVGPAARSGGPSEVG
ncbi:DUF2637 domain-containing protein, partial [Kitasatospora sp. NPDC098663]|uniref:DUF2637 domain-containing protein n=1 Tax=Kitasatospora sp. NPDC098663 TaxID=3364096 RepID=UPI0037F621A1